MAKPIDTAALRRQMAENADANGGGWLSVRQVRWLLDEIDDLRADADHLRADNARLTALVAELKEDAKPRGEG